jgi:hypothetical protein
MLSVIVIIAIMLGVVTLITHHSKLVHESLLIISILVLYLCVRLTFRAKP